MKEKSIVDPLLRVEKKIEYWSNGNIQYEYHINQKKELHGPLKRLYPNGNLSSQEEYKNGQLNGLYKDKWKNGEFNLIWTCHKREVFGIDITFQ